MMLTNMNHHGSGGLDVTDGSAKQDDAKQDDAKQDSPPLDVEALYAEHYERIVYHLRCRGTRRDPGIAEELAQETFVRAVEHLGGLRDPDKALAWLRQVADNLYNDWCRAVLPYQFQDLGAIERRDEKDRSRPWDEFDPETADPLMMADPTGLDDPSTPELDDTDRDDAWDDPWDDAGADRAGADWTDADWTSEDDREDAEFPVEPDLELSDLGLDEDGEDIAEDAAPEGEIQRRQRRRGPDDGFTGKARLQARYWKYSPERTLLLEERQSHLEVLDSLVPTLLPPNQRRALLLRMTEELSFAEIGQRLGISPSTARVHVSRALERLRGLLTNGAEIRVEDPYPAWLEQAEARANAGDLVGAAYARAQAGWFAAGASVRHSASLRALNPDDRILSDPSSRDTDAARTVRHLLTLARREVPRATAVFESVGLHVEAADAWTGLGVALHQAELYEAARPALLSALASYQAAQRTTAEHRSEIAFVQSTLGCVCTGLELFKEGERAFKRALRILRGLGDGDELARTWIQAAEHYVKQGDRATARKGYRRAGKIWQHIRGNPAIAAFIQQRLAFIDGRAP